MEYEKDYSLLRPFVPGEAEHGTVLCDKSGRADWKFIAGPDSMGHVAAIYTPKGIFSTFRNEGIYIAPLAWVEWKPVYKGDRLWWVPAAKFVHVVGYEKDKWANYGGLFILEDGETDGDGAWLNKVTWTPPKVKREIKLLAHLDADQLFWLREGAQPKWPAVRVPSEDKTVEVEEPDH